ncbi:AI-2E family transporter [Paenibacillus crassostreae]|uniref:Permease n=1 Tax=Paenibacillus crassostreae TaxID=1763538 RepID=A0A167FF38_9BACL|nr:AI-2E family transporter [Paenibacillus crassostreae]AOZ94471.1 AI-2E family transporter [Paenibacillus crassostreae]OAB76491.1 permease [Paenibacillus crassostreae]
MTISNRFIRLCIAVILLLLIIYLGSLVDFIFQPVFALFNMIIIVPFLLAGFLYYLLRPLVDLMERKKITRTYAILIIYVVALICVVGFIIGLWPPLVDQLLNLVTNAPNLFNSLSQQLGELEKSGFLAGVLPDDASPLTQLTEYLNQGFVFLTNYVSGLVSFFSNFAIILFTFPLFLFYMLKEGEKFGKRIVGFLPKRFRDVGIEVLSEIDTVLSGFIVGRVLVNVFLGILMYIGFLIIGLPYALLLTVIAVILNFIPFVGAILSSIPIVIIGFVESPSVAIWSLIVILVAQQIQDNILAPYIFGKQLDIHPLTTIILVLASGDLLGIVGIITIIPLYMVIKIVVSKVYIMYFKNSWEEL